MIVRQFFYKVSVMVVVATMALGLTEIKLQAFQLDSSTFEDENVQSIELSQGGSRRLKFQFQIPELQVENPEVIKATPVSPSEILITGLKPGVSTLKVSDSDRNLHILNVHVTVDVRKLQRAISNHFPDSSVTVHALQTGVVLKGNVARSGDVNNVMLVANDYFTNVINQLKVGGGQTVAIQVKVYEVSRTKLRELGVDFSAIGPDFNIISGFSDLITNFADGSATNLNYRLGIFGDDANVNFIVKALEQRNIAKLLDEPTLTAENGRPAEFLSGGEIPIQVASGFGNNTIEFRAFGTKLDMVPIIHGQGEMTLEVRAEVSEIANELSNGTNVPGFRVRRVNTAVRMRAGHTLALAGDYREETENQIRGLPHWMDKPFFNTFLSNKRDQNNETELVFLITPRFVTDVPANLIPNNLPGRNSSIPSDHELYINGHMEVPRCEDDCPLGQPHTAAPAIDPAAPISMNFQNSQPYSSASYPQAQQQQGNQNGFAPKVQPAQSQNSFGYPGSIPPANNQQNGFNWPNR